jgi:hypothetical protein
VEKSMVLKCLRRIIDSWGKTLEAVCENLRAQQSPHANRFECTAQQVKHWRLWEAPSAAPVKRLN